MRRLRPNGLVAVDNVLWSGDVVRPEAQDDDVVAIRAFNERVLADPRVECVMLPGGGRPHTGAPSRLEPSADSVRVKSTLAAGPAKAHDRSIPSMMSEAPTRRGGARWRCVPGSCRSSSSAAVSAAPAARAGGAAAASVPALVVPAGTERVEVDLVVRDRHGALLRDLRPRRGRAARRRRPPGDRVAGARPPGRQRQTRPRPPPSPSSSITSPRPRGASLARGARVPRPRASSGALRRCVLDRSRARRRAGLQQRSAAAAPGGRGGRRDRLDDARRASASGS